MLCPITNHLTTDSPRRSRQVLGGYRATLNNPRTSDAAKQHAQERIDEITGTSSKTSTKHHGKHEKETDDEHAHRVSNRGLMDTEYRSKADPTEIVCVRSLVATKRTSTTPTPVSTACGAPLSHIMSLVLTSFSNFIAEASKEHSREVLAEYGVVLK